MSRREVDKYPMSLRTPINLTLIALLAYMVGAALKSVDGHAVVAVLVMAALVAYNWNAFNDEESNERV